jgi:malic enzyme
MTDNEVEDFYKELEEHYGDRLVNFEHYPKQFANQVKLYKYYKERKENESGSLQ